jgi:hypothetical protein
MNSRNTWVWIIVAVVLLGVILVLEQLRPPPATGLTPLLPGFNARIVTHLQVAHAGQGDLWIERTNAVWQLTKPIRYPAQAASVENLLLALQNLAPISHLSSSELHRRPNADAEFGFDPPRITLVFQTRRELQQIFIGNRTAPGDQVYVRVGPGVTGIYLVDADLLKLIPRSVDEWRDTGLVDLAAFAFDRIIVSNAATVIEVQHFATNNSWVMHRPVRGRADGPRMIGLLQQLHALRVSEFLTDSPADLEVYGLQPPELEISLAQGTNVAAVLEFGKSPATNAAVVHARRQGTSTIVTVPKEPLAPWRAPANDFRDPQLIAVPRPPDQIEFRGGEGFTLRRESSNAWRAAGQEFRVDSGLAYELVTALTRFQIVHFKDAVTEPDLPGYGLASPSRQIILRAGVTNGPGITNVVIADLAFGATNEGRVFVRRADENPIYAVLLSEYQKLPVAAWQFRERRLWSFTTNDVARLTIRQGEKVRQLIRNGPNSWSLDQGSQGVINNFAIEEAAHRFGELAATWWLARGESALPAHGFSPNGHSLEFELKSGQKLSVVFGGKSASEVPYASAPLEGQPWIFEFPLSLYYDLVVNHLSIPSYLR